MPARPLHGAPLRAPVAPVHRGPGAGSSHAVNGAPNAALLIDFDNVTLGIRSDLQSELRNLLSSDIVKGKVAVQRAYADWRRYPQYIVPLAESSIDLIYAPAYGSSKKNATDIRLAVDAIELVFTRPEIGTYILLSGDSDFSSMVLKLKEYGKYVIGVGIRESSSDLLVQNCDEYYSYNALAGLVKTNEEESVRKDPWELVVESVARMKTNGDVMRADRLKQVMQEIDPNFDEGDLGMAKFSKFCLEASQRGLLKVTKLENGQLEVAPAGDVVIAAGKKPAASSSRPAAPPPVAAPAESAERAERDGRGRRGRRGRGRDRVRDREESPREPGQDASAVSPSSGPGLAAGIGEPAHASHAPHVSHVPVAHAASAAHPAQRGTTEPDAMAGKAQSPPRSDDGIGRSGERLARDEAFALVRRAVSELATGDSPVAADAVRRRVFAILGRDSESLNERFFFRILRDAHDAAIVDVRKRGDSYEVAPAASVPTVSEQLSKAAAAHAPAAGASAPVMRSITGRRATRGKPAPPPPGLLSVGVVELGKPVSEKPPVKAAVPKVARKRAAAKRPAAKQKPKK
jgi:uncharacterized protein (TIGR00288 family)